MKNAFLSQRFPKQLNYIIRNNLLNFFSVYNEPSSSVPVDGRFTVGSSFREGTVAGLPGQVDHPPALRVRIPTRDLHRGLRNERVLQRQPHTRELGADSGVVYVSGGCCL